MNKKCLWNCRKQMAGNVKLSAKRERKRQQKFVDENVEKEEY